MSSVERGHEGLAIVTPVFNDWICANELVSRIAKMTNVLPPTRIFLVDDGSTDATEIDPGQWPSGLEEVCVVHTGSNLGHQRAIAIGLAVALEEQANQLFAVIDADGEDDPNNVQVLIDALSQDPSSVVVAQRQDRTENLGFRAFYRLYKWLFRILTGRVLDFGNFSAMSRPTVERLLYMPELWNHFPATVMRSKLEVVKVPTARSTRFHGESRMNFVSLVNHGLAAISAFSDVVFARLLIAVSVLTGLVASIGLGVVAVRLSTSLAIPGWATAATGFVVIALFQLLALLALVTFIQLSTRSTIPTTPISAARHYTRSITQVLTA